MPSLTAEEESFVGVLGQWDLSVEQTEVARITMIGHQIDIADGQSACSGLGGVAEKARRLEGSCYGLHLRNDRHSLVKSVGAVENELVRRNALDVVDDVGRPFRRRISFASNVRAQLISSFPHDDSRVVLVLLASVRVVTIQHSGNVLLKRRRQIRVVSAVNASKMLVTLTYPEINTDGAVRVESVAKVGRRDSTPAEEGVL